MTSIEQKTCLESPSITMPYTPGFCVKVETQSHDWHPSEKNRICSYLKIILFNILFVQKVDYKWPNLSQILDTMKMPVYQHAPCILKKKLFPADIFGQTQFFFTTKVLITFYKNNITTTLATRLTVKMRVQMYRF